MKVPSQPDPDATQDTRNTAPATRTPLTAVPAGVVKVVHLQGEWWHVAIGREKSAKRFNLSRGEAAELVRQLLEQVLTEDAPDRRPA